MYWWPGSGHWAAKMIDACHRDNEFYLDGVMPRWRDGATSFARPGRPQTAGPLALALCTTPLGERPLISP